MFALKLLKNFFNNTVIHCEFQSSFENLLRKDRSVSIYYRNIRSFVIEIYKIKNNMSTPVMSELLEKRNFSYNLRSQTDFSLHSVDNVAYGLKSLKYFAGKVWSIIPFKIRNARSIEEFSAKIKAGDLKIVHVRCVWPTYIKWVTLTI